MELFLKPLLVSIDFTDESIIKYDHIRYVPKNIARVDYIVAAPECSKTRIESSAFGSPMTFLHVDAYDLLSVITVAKMLGKFNKRRLFYGCPDDALRNLMRIALPWLAAPGETVVWRNRARAARPVEWAAVGAAAAGGCVHDPR